jgi:hypothetical protein
MLEILFLIVGILKWISSPLIILLIYRWYKNESRLYRVILGITLSVISVLILYILEAMIYAELMLRNNPF